jgi:ribonuclease-3
MTPSREQFIRDFLARFNVEVQDIGIFHQALTHRSYSYENPGERDNERLEFLGDAVLSLLVCERLYRDYPDSSEGELSRLKSALVNRTILGKLAREMHMGEVILLGKGEEQTGGRHRISVLGSALESLIGALYLSVGSEATARFVARHVIEPAEKLLQARRVPPGEDRDLATGEEDLVDYKSQLQEMVQKQFQSVPDYRTVRESGPDHAKSFVVEVLIRGQVFGVGHGHRKKTAENHAAKKALEKLTNSGIADSDPSE